MDEPPPTSKYTTPVGEDDSDQEGSSSFLEEGEAPVQATPNFPTSSESEEGNELPLG